MAQEAQDLFDTTPAAPPPAPPPQQAAPAGGDMFDQVDPPKDAGTLAGGQKSWWDSVKQWSGEGLLSKVPVPFAPNANLGDVGSFLDQKVGGAIQEVANREASNNHPWRSNMASGMKALGEAVPEAANQISSPINLGLMATGGLESRLVKAGLALSNLYFAYRGSQNMDLEKLPKETTGEYAQRILSDPNNLAGAAAIIGGGTGLAGDVAGAVDIQRNVMKHALGVDGDLEGQVNDAVNTARDIKQRAADRAKGIVDQAQQETQAAQGQQAAAKGQAAQTAQQATEQIPLTIGGMMRDALPVVLSEHARVSQPFTEMKELAKDANGRPEAVSDNQSVRASMVDTMLSHDIQEHEIPSRIFDALTDKGVVEEQQPIDGIQPGNPIYNQLAEAVGVGAEAKPVFFGDLTRIRGDVWEARQAATDGRIRHALDDTLDTVTKMQEDYAVNKNFGETNRPSIDSKGNPTTINGMYSDAKFQYMKFKRELGSSLMSDFTKAETLRQQNMGDALSKLMSPRDGATMRQLLQMAGVDTKPFDELVNRKEAALSVLKQKDLPGGVEKAQAKAKKVISKGQKQVTELGKESPVPGKSIFKLMGKSNEEIARDRLQAMGEQARKQGLGNPYHAILILMGLLRMPTSPVSGGFMLGRGVAMKTASGMNTKILTNPSFQDWVIRESGVHPANTTLIGKMRNAMRRLATSGVLANTAANAQ